MELFELSKTYLVTKNKGGEQCLRAFPPNEVVEIKTNFKHNSNVLKVSHYDFLNNTYCFDYPCGSLQADICMGKLVLEEL